MDEEEDEFILYGFEPGMPILVETTDKDMFVGNLVSKGLTGICTQKTHRLEEVELKASEESVEFIREHFGAMSLAKLRLKAVQVGVGVRNTFAMAHDQLVEACTNKVIRAQLAEMNNTSIVSLATPILTFTPWDRINTIESAEDYSDEAVLRDLDFGEDLTVTDE